MNSNGDIVFSADALQRAAVAGITAELSAAMRNQYGTGERLRKMVNDTIEKNTPLIERQIQAAILDALKAPEFAGMVRDAILAGLKGKFAGAFEGVLRAAGKKAAQDELVVIAAVKAARGAMGGE